MGVFFFGHALVQMPRYANALRGALAAQCVTTALVVFAMKPTRSLRAWYRTLGVGAVTLDVLSLSLGAYIGLAAHDRLAAQVGIAVLVGVVHDLAFGYLVRSTPSGRNRAIDLFQRYADEKRLRIVLDDALMIAGAVIAARALARSPHADATAALAAYVNVLLVYAY